jgi:hypothetical protein
VSDIEVECSQSDEGWLARVTVTDDASSPGSSAGSRPGSTCRFEVGVSAAELARFDPGAADPGPLVRRSFEFLLAREPKESILHSFGLSLIGRYFPEFEREIRRR